MCNYDNLIGVWLHGLYNSAVVKNKESKQHQQKLGHVDRVQQQI